MGRELLVGTEALPSARSSKAKETGAEPNESRRRYSRGRTWREEGARLAGTQEHCRVSVFVQSQRNVDHNQTRDTDIERVRSRWRDKSEHVPGCRASAGITARVGPG